MGGIPVENESLKLDHKKSGDYTQTPDRHMSKLAASRSVLTQKPGMPYNALHGSMVSLQAHRTASLGARHRINYSQLPSKSFMAHNTGQMVDKESVIDKQVN